MAGLKKNTKKLVGKIKNKAEEMTAKRVEKAWESPTVTRMLKPLTGIYIKGFYIKERLVKPYKASIPVICVGNLTVGGNGKTPLAVTIAKLAKDKGLKPFFLTRGYKGELQTVIITTKSLYSANQVGDEPLLLAREAPVVVDGDRARGAELAEKKGAGFIIMDDGFQNTSLAKDKTILVFDGKTGIGNGNVLPAGPLREPFDEGINKASAAVIVGDDLCGITSKIKEIRPDIPLFQAALIPDKEAVGALQGKDVLAFSGIGKPDKFFTMLQEYGVNAKEKVVFPDHHFYTEDELSDLLERAKSGNLLITTTEKDAVKLPALFSQYVKTIPVTLTVTDNDKAAFESFLDLK